MITISIYLAILLAILIIRLVYNRVCLKNLTASLSFSGGTATEGDTMHLTEELFNQKWLPLPWINVKFQVDKSFVFKDGDNSSVSDAFYRSDLFHILMHQRVKRRLPFTCSRRGFYLIKSLEITGWDVLMESKHVAAMDCSAHLLVYPGVLDTDEVDDVCTRAYGHLVTRQPIFYDQFSFRGIREYSPTDPVKNINFKASAKAQDLMVNIRDYTGARQIVLMLDIERYRAWHDEDMEERAIKLVASLAEKMVGQGIPLAFVTNGINQISGEVKNVAEGLGPVHLKKILEIMACIDISNQEVTHFAEILDGYTLCGNLEPEFWFVSTNIDRNIEAAYNRLKNTGVRSVWIMPGLKPREWEFIDDVRFV